MVMHVVYFSSGKRVLISQNGVILERGIVIRHFMTLALIAAHHSKEWEMY